MEPRTQHHGKSIRALRQLRGLKQDTFAKKLGMSQQNVSKMESKKKISDEQLEQAAKVLSTSVEFLKQFDDKAVFQTNIINENQVNHFNSTKEILEYFESKLDKKNQELDKLKTELEQLKNKNNKIKASKANSSSLQSVPGKRAAQ